MSDVDMFGGGANVTAVLSWLDNSVNACEETFNSLVVLEILVVAVSSWCIYFSVLLAILCSCCVCFAWSVAATARKLCSLF